MKRAVVFIFIITFILGISVCAAEEKAYVTVSNEDVVFANKEVVLKDADGDGKTTINDALIIAHTNPDDYGYENTEYGISMTKLCGVENGGAYGYYLNNAPAMSLSDEISNGDTVIMLSDGIIPSGEDAAWLPELLRKSRELSRTELAKKIIEEALRFGAGADDMTVLVIKIEEIE